MGKATRWLRGLFGIKRPDPNPNPNPNPTSNKRSSKDRRRNKWSLVKSHRDTTDASTSSSLVGPTKGGGGDDDASSKHSIAVAKAAVAAAHAAAAVVRLTTGGGATCNDGTPTMRVQVSYGGDVDNRVWAAVVIQSYFRSYLARRALRALKGLVKLQALVRGHIMRKKTKETMHCMQAMLRAQARARSVRASSTESPHSSTKSSLNQHPGPPTPEKFEIVHVKSAKHDQTPKIRRNGSKTSWSNIVNPDKGNFGSSWSDPRMDEPTWDQLRGVSSTRTCLTDDERGDRILEVDPGKPFFNIKRRNLFESSHSGLLTSDHITHSYTTSKDSTHQTQEIEDGSYCTAENSPQYYSSGSQGGGSRRGPFTPAKSDGSRSFLSGYSDCPSYMAYTESAKAKMRSHSAPKQRPQYERASSINKRYSVHGFGEHNPRSNAQRASTLQASFTSKAYPGSGRLDRLGMPVRDSTVVYYSGYLN